MNCHNCPHRDDPNRLPRCLACTRADDLSHHGRAVHLNGTDVAAKPTNQLRQVTTLPTDVEDRLREALCGLFGLDPVDLLLVQHLFAGGRLSTFDETRDRVAQKLAGYHGSPRAQAHAAKERIMRAFPLLEPVLQPIVGPRDRAKDTQIAVEARLDADTVAPDLFENSGLSLDAQKRA